MTCNKKFKKIKIKDCSYHCLDNLFNINYLVLKNLKIDKKSYRGILTYFVVYEASYGVKPLCMYCVS